MMFCYDFQFYIKDNLRCRYNFKDGTFTDLLMDKLLKQMKELIL